MWHPKYRDNQEKETVLEQEQRAGEAIIELETEKVRAISLNTEVEICSDDYHSSYFRDRPRQLLVYIKPLKKAQDWFGGIAVSMEQLLPLRIRDFNVET